MFEVWSWPAPPKSYINLDKYTLNSILEIPTGSLYFASRRGPLSEISTRFTGSPYDMIGIIFQTLDAEEPGTYVFTMDQSLKNSNPQLEKVVVINLKDLIRDETIIHQAVIPLKDPGSSILKARRDEIFKELFQKYKEVKPEYDAYQTIASMLSLPVAENFRTKTQMTSAELVGLILFQAGLIWDYRISDGEINPVMLYRESFFQTAPESTDSNEVKVRLMTLEYYTKYYMKYYKQGRSRHRKRSQIGQKRLDDSAHDDSTHDNSAHDDSTHDDLVHGNLDQGYPIKRPIHALTILFGSLRPVDFLRSYYESLGINPENDLTFFEGFSSPQMEQIMPKLQSLCLLRSNCPDKFKGCSGFANKLNLVWYHENLIPIELENENGQSKEIPIVKDYQAIENLLERMGREYLQKQALNLSMISLTRNFLAKVTLKISKFAYKLHSLAEETRAYIRNQEFPEGILVEQYQDKTKTLKFLVQIIPGQFRNLNHSNYSNYSDPFTEADQKYELLLYHYMWGNGWVYDWKTIFLDRATNLQNLIDRVKELVEEVHSLRNRMPQNCILLELLIHLQKQAELIHNYLNYSQKARRA